MFFSWHISPQFNAVSYRVISTVLIDSEARPAQRARVISAWVDVAQVVFISVLGIVILPGSSKSLNDICIGHVDQTFFFSRAECISSHRQITSDLCFILFFFFPWDSCFFVSFFFCSGTAGAKELLVVESDRLRVAIKPNLQTEEGLAGGSWSCRIIVMTMIIIMAMMMPPTLSFSSRFPHLGGLSREAGDVWGVGQVK